MLQKYSLMQTDGWALITRVTSWKSLPLSLSNTQSPEFLCLPLTDRQRRIESLLAAVVIITPAAADAMWLMRVLRSARLRFFLAHPSSPLQLCVVTSRAAAWLGRRGGIREKRSAGENESPRRTGSCARLVLLLIMQRLQQAWLSLSMHSADSLDMFDELIL